MPFDLSYLLLSTQTALLGYVVSKLRAVTINFDADKKFITLHFFYDGKINNELFELASCASAEITLGPDFRGHYFMNDDLAIQLDYPKKIPIHGELVYLRREHIHTNYKTENPVHADRLPVLAALRLNVQKALLGKVTPALRSVDVGIDGAKKTLGIYFVYDGEISKEDLALADLAISEAVTSFPGFHIDKEVSRLDYPDKIPYKGGLVVFSRYEEKS